MTTEPIYQIRLFNTVENIPSQAWMDVSKALFDEKEDATGERWCYQTRILYAAQPAEQPRGEPVAYAVVDPDDMEIERLSTSRDELELWRVGGNAIVHCFLPPTRNPSKRWGMGW